jgi:hypothetical protein
VFGHALVWLAPLPSSTFATRSSASPMLVIEQLPVLRRKKDCGRDKADGRLTAARSRGV